MDSLRMLLILLVVVLQETGTLSFDAPLILDYYREICPLAEEIVQREVAIAVLKDPRMAASLLRLHFHDCFVLGCDASVLLDNSVTIVSEKQAVPNINSLRGFEVIDRIKYLLEEACPCTVSCADILALAARDSVFLRGGPSWNVYLGRKDSIEASLEGANKYIPAPTLSLEELIANFALQGLDIGDLVALSGAHTIGNARCASFRQRIYEEENYEEEEYNRRYKRGTTFRRALRSMCPESSEDSRVAPLDSVSPARFDNQYFHNIIRGEGLLQSDNVLVSQDIEGEIKRQVWRYARDEKYFFESFVKSIVKMGSIHVLTGVEGQIRTNCRYINI